jgi:hypothetical protein
MSNRRAFAVGGEAALREALAESVKEIATRDTFIHLEQFIFPYEIQRQQRETP